MSTCSPTSRHDRVRYDRRGRRIGRNWWREYVMSVYWSQVAARDALRGSGRPIHTDAVAGAGYDSGYYQLSDAEFAVVCPHPTLKALLIGLSQATTREDQAA